MQVGGVGFVGDEGGADSVVRRGGGEGRSWERRMTRRFSSLVAKERSQQRGRGGGGRVGTGAVWTRRTLVARRRSPGQLRRTANDGALGGAETVPQKHHHVKHTKHTTTTNNCARTVDKTSRESSSRSPPPFPQHGHGAEPFLNFQRGENLTRNGCSSKPCWWQRRILCVRNGNSFMTAFS